MAIEDPTPSRPATPGAPPAPETPDRPHGDPLAPEVPTDAPPQPGDDPTVDRLGVAASRREVAAW